MKVSNSLNKLVFRNQYTFQNFIILKEKKAIKQIILKNLIIIFWSLINYKAKAIMDYIIVLCRSALNSAINALNNWTNDRII